MKAGQKIFYLSLGDGLSKVLYFLSFVYLARVLGVEGYGVLEFSVSIVAYFLLLADSGMEIWGMRAIAQGQDFRLLIGKILPMKSLLALFSMVVLIGLLPFLPNYPSLKLILLLYGVSLFAQALSLKWVLMGQERYFNVGCGLALSQIIFALGVVITVKGSSQLVWVPIFKIVADLFLAGYFGGVVFLAEGWGHIPFTLTNALEVLRPSVTMGATQTLGILNYNFDTIILGLMLGPVAVGLYGAAYKPITAMLAIPLMVFLGLLPILSRAYMENEDFFRGIVFRLQKISALVILPCGVLATFSAPHIIELLYGKGFQESVIALQVLSWSFVLVVLRGVYRQALLAIGQQVKDLTCAGVSAGVNIFLTVILIPMYGMVGAAVATVLSDIAWFGLISYYAHTYIDVRSHLKIFGIPILGIGLMVLLIWSTASYFWGLQIFVGSATYLMVLFFLREPELLAILGRPGFPALSLKHLPKVG